MMEKDGGSIARFYYRAAPFVTLSVFAAAVAIGVGQFRRVTGDEEHTIARYKRLLAPLRVWRLEKIVFTGSPHSPEALPQARLAIAPCVLADANVTPTLHRATDTSLVILPKADAWKASDVTTLWYAEDDMNRYALLIPTAR